MSKAIIVTVSVLLASIGLACGQAVENPVVGNTLQANYTMHSKTCTSSGICTALPSRQFAENIYFSPNGNVYEYGTGNRGGIFPLNKMVKTGAISKGYFVRRDVVEYRAVDNELTASFLYRISGQQCTVSRRTTTGSDLRVSSQIKLEFCRIVPGRVER